ncbi:uncharacterized protein LOC128882923 [Hylaeus volcanicus]|uniref:uncharacterized protein LOC128882923 n=1 Tax=Hylaeus volcanicus TaxID=313075 RepID=UPI0023B818FC|nr:uncharacterized protein LOC128882923 [Hylaeus volcanicus]XP_053990745.1 uncharacterized protein LOC128882923 [Hylaeus volcanicus]
MENKPLESGNAVLQTVHCSEGGRAFKLLQERHRRLKGVEAAKTEIDNETKKRRICDIHEKYTGSILEDLEVEFQEQTVGLISAEEFREKRQRLLEKMEERSEMELAKISTPVKSNIFISQIQKTKLSFIDDCSTDEDEMDESSLDIVKKSNAASHFTSKNNEIKRGIKKDTTVDTSFLCDAEREKRLYEEKEKIIKEYYLEQKRIKEEPLEITYSYWDGLGHRRCIQVKKGTSVGEFLSLCRESLEKEFPKLKSISTENLMYIKEDLILPHQVTFYELIKNKAKGKSGPLFNFDVHDDVRLYSDASVEKDESHAGKIVDRKWYKANKHIFPASRWELYDSTKTYEKYTIRGSYDHSKEIVP